MSKPPTDVSTSDVERACVDLSQALADVGAERPAAPAELSVLDEIAVAIEPLRLPADVRRFWELLDPASIEVSAHPWLTRPEFALEVWENHVRELSATVPRVLFPFAYESHSHLCVELSGPDQDDGGALFSWCYGGHRFLLVFRSVVEHLDYMTAAIRAGRFERNRKHLLITDDSLVDKPPAPISHPVFGAIDPIPDVPDKWPVGWRLRSGLGSAGGND